MKRMILLFAMLFVVLHTEGIVYAEEQMSPETETLILETEEEKIVAESLYEIQDIKFQMNNTAVVTIVLNTTEGIEDAIVEGIAREKGGKVQYKFTEISETEITAGYL